MRGFAFQMEYSDWKDHHCPTLLGSGLPTVQMWWHSEDSLEGTLAQSACFKSTLGPMLGTMDMAAGTPTVAPSDLCRPFCGFNCDCWTDENRNPPENYEQLVTATLVLLFEQVSDYDVLLPRLRKTYSCTYISGDGRPCASHFRNRYRLTRHGIMHCDRSQRKYPCSLPGCGQRSGRSDNARDHFKTHLRHTGRRRNGHFTWEVVKTTIQSMYEDDEAAKLLAHLDRWVEAGMPNKIRHVK